MFNASHRQSDWNNFVQAVPECAPLVSTGRTFDCLRNASSIEILNGFEVSLALANELLPWVPTIDGPGGLIADLPSKLYTKGEFARVPFIAGTNLDEGLSALFTRHEELTYRALRRNLIHTSYYQFVRNDSRMDHNKLYHHTVSE